MSRPYRPRSYQSREPLYRLNGKIRAREVRVFQVLDGAKQQLGVIDIHEALRLARERNMDLIEIAPTATPPVCRIESYGKFLYEQSKLKKEPSGSAGKMKEIQISPSIEPHDLQTKLEHCNKFLDQDMKVRVKLRFRGRQKAHKEFGYQVMNKLIEGVAAYGQADSPPQALGDRDLTVNISPLPRNKRPKKAQPAADPESPPKSDGQGQGSH